jgi:hypothetical protein
MRPTNTDDPRYARPQREKAGGDRPPIDVTISAWRGSAVIGVMTASTAAADPFERVDKLVAD